MKFVVVTLRRAEADINCIYAWISDRSLQGASSWYQAAREAIKKLARDAGQHEYAPERADLGQDIRQKIFRTRRGLPYRLIHAVVGHEVRVLRVRGPGQAPVTADDLCE